MEYLPRQVEGTQSANGSINLAADCFLSQISTIAQFCLSFAIWLFPWAFLSAMLSTHAHFLA